MLKMALKYRTALDNVTADKALKLRKYELDEEDWQIVADLARVLKVCISNNITINVILILEIDLQGSNTILLSGQCLDNCQCNPHHGPHQQSPKG